MIDSTTGWRREEAIAGKRNRQRNRDALDVFRLLQEVELDDLLVGFAKYAADDHARTTSTEALAFLSAHGVKAGDLLPNLLGEQLVGELWAPDAFAGLCGDLVSEAEKLF